MIVVQFGGLENENEEIPQYEQFSTLQRLLMNNREESIQEITDFIFKYFSGTTNQCIQLSYLLLLPVKYRSNSFDNILKILVYIVQNETFSGPLSLLKSHLLNAIIHEILSDKVISYQNSIQAFLYYCFQNDYFTISDVMTVFEKCYSRFKISNEAICSLFFWFAPEIEDFDKDKFVEYLQAFQFHLQCTTFHSVYQDMLDNFGNLKQNNWQLYREMRDSFDFIDPVYQAIRNDDIEELQKLVAVNMFDPDKHFDISPFESSWILKFKPTAIQLAAFFGSVNCFKFLMLNYDHNLIYESTPLSYYSVAGGNHQIIHLTEQINDDFSNVLNSSVIFHQYDIFEWLIENKINQNEYEYNESKDDSILHYAIITDNINLLQYLSEHHKNIEETDEYGMNLLHYACKYGNFSVLSYLIYLDQNDIENPKNHKKINIKDHQNMTPLHYAIKYHNDECTKILLDQPGINVNSKNFEGYTPLHFAVETRNSEIVKMLLNHPMIERHSKNNNRITPAIMASKLKYDEIKELFLSSSIRPRTTPSLYRRPITGATRPLNVLYPNETRPSTTINRTRKQNKCNFKPEKSKIIYSNFRNTSSRNQNTRRSYIATPIRRTRIKEY